MCSLEWSGRLNCRAIGLDVSLSSLSTSRRCSRGIVRLVVFLFRQQRPLDSRTRTTTSTRFSYSETVSARQVASFGVKNAVGVVILLRDFAKMSQWPKKVTNTVAGLSLLNQESAQLSAIKIPEQTMVLTKSKVNLPEVFILLVFHLKLPVKSRTRSRPRPRI